MRKLLEEDIRSRTSATIRETRTFLESFAGKTLSEPTLRKLLKRMGFSRKKESGGDGTRRVAKSRLEGDGIRRPRCSLSGFCGRDGHEYLAFCCVWFVQEGREGLLCSVPRSRGKNTTLLATMTIEGMGPSLAVEGATNAKVFETYVERVLGPGSCAEVR